MSDPVTGLVAGGSLLGGLLGANEERQTAKDASAAQVEAAKLGIDETRRQFDLMQKLLSPYVSAGTGSLTGQQDLLGLSGNAAQQAAFAGIQNSPQMQALQQQGENAILQNASATGGLRGGNTQAALAQFRPQILSQLIESQFSKLGGLTNLGQASAAGVGAAAQNTGSQISGLLGDIGSYKAGYQMAKGASTLNKYNTILGAAGMLGGF